MVTRSRGRPLLEPSRFLGYDFVKGCGRPARRWMGCVDIKKAQQAGKDVTPEDTPTGRPPPQKFC
jgi:hypothetical protein